MRINRQLSTLKKAIRSGCALVCFDGRAPGVKVPRSLSREPLLFMYLGAAAGVPRSKVKISREGFSVRLAYKGKAFAFRVPGAAVLGSIALGRLPSRRVFASREGA